MPPPKKAAERGRPRSEAARQAVFEAILGMVEEVGYSGVTMEALAARSGVGKPTIYRWWSNKGVLLTEAYRDFTSRNPIRDVPDHGNLLDDLLCYAPRITQAMNGLDGKVLQAVMIESQVNPEFEAGYRVVMQQRWEPLEMLVARALNRGELTQIPGPIIYESFFGTIAYRAMTRRAPLDHAFGEELAQQIHRLLMSY